MTDRPRVRPFADFFREHGRGRTHDELSTALHDLVARVKDTGKKGTVTLTVQVEPVKKDDRLVLVSDKLTLKLPEHDRPAGYWFIGEDGNLQRDDPNQMTFDSLHEVPAPADAPDGVDRATGEAADGYPIPATRKA